MHFRNMDLFYTKYLRIDFSAFIISVEKIGPLNGYMWTRLQIIQNSAKLLVRYYFAKTVDFYLTL